MRKRHGFRQHTNRIVSKSVTVSDKSRSNGTLVFTLFVMILVTITFILVLDKRVDDQAARNTIRTEEPQLDDAVENLHKSLSLEHSLLTQKNISVNLLEEYTLLKMWIDVNFQKINSINNLSELGAAINGTITNIAIGYYNQITKLEETLQDLLSVSSQTNGITLKSGVCTLLGLTSLSIDYSYKKLTISGLDYYYYVFNSTNGINVDIDNTGASIQSCSPSIYVGPQNTISPIFKKQLDSFTGSGVDEIVGIQAGANKLIIKTSTFGGTRTFGISAKKITHFISFA